MAKAELQAILDCDNKPFIRAMDAAVRKQKMAGKQMESGWKNVGSSMMGLAGRALPFAAIAAGAVVAGKATFNAAGDIKDMADSVGLTTDQFQQYSFALEQAGGNEETLVKGLTNIIAKMDDARDGNDKTIKQFAAMGVAQSELADIQPAEVILRMSDALKKANGDLDITAAAMDLIGKKVAIKMIPALKDGREAFLEVGASASIMEAESINAMEGLGDKLNQIKKTVLARTANAIARAAMQTMQIPGMDSKPGEKSFNELTGETPVMDEITVTPGRRPGFWQQDLPAFSKPRGGPQERMGPFPDEAMNTPENWGGQFRSFSAGYFPGKSGGLTTGGLATGGLTTGGLNGGEA
jgi:hypothetical protein